MKKKLTDEEIGKAIGKLAEEVRRELDYDFRVAQSQMWLAEDDLVKTLNEKQLSLYKNFCEKRKVFFEISSEIYQKNFNT